MLPPVAMQTTKKPASKFVDSGITFCLFVLLLGCTPPEKTALENGSQLLADGQPEKALIELERALDFISKNEELKKNPKIMGHLHNQIGFAHQTLFRDTSKTNHYSEANRAYLFTTTNLNSPPSLKQRAHLNLAWLYLERFKWSENLPAFRENANRAADEFDKLRVSINDDEFSYWLEKGTAELHAGRFVSARESFKKVDEQSANALNGLGVLAAIDGRYEAATGHFEAAITADTKNAKSYLHLAISRQAMGQHQAALDAYKAYLSVAPESTKKKAQVQDLVEDLQAYLKPEPEEEPIAEKTEKLSEVVEPETNEKIEPEESVEEEKAEEVVASTEPEESVASTEPEESVEEKKVEEVVASTEPEESVEEEKVEEVAVSTEPERETGEVVVIEPPVEEVVVGVVPSETKALPVPETKLSEKMPEVKEQPESKPEVAANTDLNEEVVEEGKTKKKWTERLNPVRWFDRGKQPESKPEVATNTDLNEVVEEGETKKKWTERLNPVRWFDGETKKKSDKQLTWKSRTPLPELPSIKPIAPASTNTARVASLLPTAVAYPRYTYLHPALPKAGDRQVAKTYLDDGVTAQKSKEWQRAKAAYLEAVKADPVWFEARFKLGQASYYTGETSLALQSFENALSIDPNDGPARFNFAMSLVQGNYYADAVQELETFLQFDPNSVQGHLEAGNIYAEKLRDIEKAAIHYKRVIGLNPDHPQAVNMRYWLIRNKAN